MMAIAIGDTAPDFQTTDQNGEAVELSKLRSEKAIVLYFYPKDETPG